MHMNVAAADKKPTFHWTPILTTTYQKTPTQNQW